MFIENENLVDESTENTEETVEQTEGTEELEDVSNDNVEEVTEEPEKQEETFTKKQVDEMIAKKLARKEARIRKEFENKYSRLETVVNTGLGTDSIEESTNKLEEFYTEKGIKIPSAPKYTEREEEQLASMDADDVIDSGLDDVIEEVDRLAKIGVENMTNREKIYFLKLANYREATETENSFRAKGISKEEINSQEFKDIMESINPKLSNEKKIEMYLKLKPKKETKKIGSVKSGMTSQVKDYYTPEEIERLTDEELDKPGVWEAVRKSMTGQ